MQSYFFLSLPPTSLHAIAPAAVVLPSLQYTNHQRLFLRKDKRPPAADTEAARLCLLAVVCPAGGGGRGAGAKWTRERQHYFNPVFVVGCEGYVVTNSCNCALLWWLSVRQKARERALLWGGIPAEYVACTAYIRSGTGYDLF